MQEAQHGTRSLVSRITPWAEGTKPLSHPRIPQLQSFRAKSSCLLFLKLSCSLCLLPNPPHSLIPLNSFSLFTAFPPWNPYSIFLSLCCFSKDFLFIHERHRKAETQAEGEAGSRQGARCGTRSWVSGIRPWTERRR